MSVDLTSTYLGLTLRNPVVASPGPVTGDPDQWRRLDDAGVGAIVLPSLFEEEIESESWWVSDLLDEGRDTVAEASDYLPEFEDYSIGPDRFLEGPSLDEDETVDALRAGRCKVLRHERAFRHAENVGALDPFGFHHREDVADALIALGHQELVARAAMEAVECGSSFRGQRLPEPTLTERSLPATVRGRRVGVARALGDYGTDRLAGEAAERATRTALHSAARAALVRSQASKSRRRDSMISSACSTAFRAPSRPACCPPCGCSRSGCASTLRYHSLTWSAERSRGGRGTAKEVAGGTSSKYVPSRSAPVTLSNPVQSKRRVPSLSRPPTLPAYGEYTETRNRASRCR